MCYKYKILLSYLDTVYRCFRFVILIDKYYVVQNGGIYIKACVVCCGTRSYSA